MGRPTVCAADFEAGGASIDVHAGLGRFCSEMGFRLLSVGRNSCSAMTSSVFMAQSWVHFGSVAGIV